MAFYGYLIQLGSTPIPMAFMKAESYTITPQQRMETEAKRSADGLLHRTTVDHTPVKIVFQTPVLTNPQMDDLNSRLQAAYTVPLERRLTITYYDPESNSYKSADCYMPDVNYNILRVEGNTIYYGSCEFTFIEY